MPDCILYPCPERETHRNEILTLFQGEYYNADEVQAMVAAEMLEEKRKKKEEEALFDDIGDIAKKKRKGPLIAD